MQAWICRCRLDGEALQGLVVGQPARLTLATRDRFGNACASGGEDVDVELHGPAGEIRKTLTSVRQSTNTQYAGWSRSWTGTAHSSQSCNQYLAISFSLVLSQAC
jgi:hypothetical protein